MPKNILLVHNYYKIPGGEDFVVKNEKKLLESHGHRVILYKRDNAELDDMSVLHKIILPLTMIFSLKTYYEVKKIIKQQKIDIVHVHNTLFLISPAVYYAAQTMKIPVVQTIHNFRLLCVGATFYRGGSICEKCVQGNPFIAVKYKCYRESYLQTLACVLSMWTHRKTGIYKKINYICLTEFNKNKLLKHKQISEKNVFVKPNFVSKRKHEIIPHLERKNQIVYAGRLDRLKGIDILLKAWKDRKKDDLKLIICGNGPMKEWCRQFVEENKIENIVFKGFVANDEVKKIVGESKALILPTQWYEGFPMSIVEAYSVGTPVVGSNMGNVGDVIVEKVTGVKFDPDSSDDLIKKINLICDMELEEKVYRVYLCKYTEKQNYQELMDIYNASIISSYRKEYS